MARNGNGSAVRESTQSAYYIATPLAAVGAVGRVRSYNDGE